MVTQTALPGLAVDPYRLEPLRPSYTKLCRQLQRVAEACNTPIASLTAHQLAAHARTAGWSAATLSTLTRVAHAHGLDIDPDTAPRPRSRPSTLSLSSLTVTGPDCHPAQQRIATLAVLLWRHPAPLAHWRRLTFADLTFAGGDVIVAGRRCHDAATTADNWRSTARRTHPAIPDDRLPFLARLDDTVAAVGERVIELDWAQWMGGTTLDRWRAWAIDNGATPVARGSDRHRHR